MPAPQTKKTGNNEQKRSEARFRIVLPQADQTITSKQEAFLTLISLLEEKNQQWKVDIKSNKKQRRLYLQSSVLNLILSFKEILVVEIRIPNLERNVAAASEEAKNVISLLNTIFGEGAQGSKVTLLMTLYGTRKIEDLPKKIISESRLATINEKMEQTLSAAGISFEIQKEDRKSLISTTHNTAMLITFKKYESEIPFDLLQLEFDELQHSIKLLDKLIQIEI